jgi:hypothetical protein
MPFCPALVIPLTSSLMNVPEHILPLLAWHTSVCASVPAQPVNYSGITSTTVGHFVQATDNGVDELTSHLQAACDSALSIMMNAVGRMQDAVSCVMAALILMHACATVDCVKCWCSSAAASAAQLHGTMRLGGSLM